MEWLFEMLNSIDIETIDAEKRFITFKNKSNSWTLDIRKEGAPAWNLVFFSQKKKPMSVPINDLSHKKIIEYFERTPTTLADNPDEN